MRPNRKKTVRLRTQSVQTVVWEGIACVQCVQTEKKWEEFTLKVSMHHCGKVLHACNASSQWCRKVLSVAQSIHATVREGIAHAQSVRAVVREDFACCAKHPCNGVGSVPLELTRSCWLYFRPPLKRANTGGAIFLSAIPIPVPMATVRIDTPKYSNSEKNVFVIGKKRSQSFCTNERINM